ncbi:hypothetical protein BaRGS_00018908 [Batillaria attramentaria]|uniref:Uncharacterized protein n=1 Tax=Batillaria attramentaria TaxID=370345 RepID=A0ABD0KS22_9CAEN
MRCRKIPEARKDHGLFLRQVCRSLPFSESDVRRGLCLQTGPPALMCPRAISRAQVCGRYAGTTVLNAELHTAETNENKPCTARLDECIRAAT